MNVHGEYYSRHGSSKCDWTYMVNITLDTGHLSVTMNVHGEYYSRHESSKCDYERTWWILL